MLDDAYAMETGLIGIVDNHASHFNADMPAAARKIQQHIVETQQHAQRLQECLRQLNASPSGVKSTVGCYTALVSVATDLGYPEVARLCQQNLSEDQAMAAAAASARRGPRCGIRRSSSSRLSTSR